MTLNFGVFDIVQAGNIKGYLDHMQPRNLLCMRQQKESWRFSAALIPTSKLSIEMASCYARGFDTTSAHRLGLGTSCSRHWTFLTLINMIALVG